MDEWDSDFIHEQGLDRNHAVKRIAELKAKRGQEQYKKVLWFEDRYDGAGEWLGQDQDIRVEAEKLVPALVKEAEEKEKAAAERSRQAAIRESERIERSQFEWLKAKFGGSR